MKIRVDGWQAGIRFDAAHMIPFHPKCGRLHGHTYALHAVVEGRADAATGLLLDFSEVKRPLKAIADRLDHHVLVQTKSPDLRVERHATGVRIACGEKRYDIPDPDAELLPVAFTTAEALAEWVADELLATVAWPDGVTAVEVGVDEGPGKGAWARRELA